MSSSYFDFFFFTPTHHAQLFVVSCVGLVPCCAHARQAFCHCSVPSLLFLLVCSYKMLFCVLSLHCITCSGAARSAQLLPPSLPPLLFLSPSPSFSAHATLPAKDECYTSAHPPSRTEARCLSFHLGRWGSRYRWGICLPTVLLAFQ